MAIGRMSVAAVGILVAALGSRVAGSGPGGPAAEPALRPVRVAADRVPGLEDTIRLAQAQATDRWLTLVRPEVATERGTYLGVATTRVTPVLRSNLKLRPGVGLVVEQVVDGSPAAAAGIRKYDILQRFNDQLLVNPQQLGTLVRLAEPGEEVEVTVLREGDAVPVKVTLEEQDVVAMDESAGAPWGDALAAEAMSFPRIMLDAKLEGTAERAMEMIRQRHNPAAAITYADPEHTLEITRKDGTRWLVAKDKAGTVVFGGPIDTKEQRAGMPEVIREKLKGVDERMKETGVSDDGRVRVRMVRPERGGATGGGGGGAGERSDPAP